MSFFLLINCPIITIVSNYWRRKKRIGGLQLWMTLLRLAIWPIHVDFVSDRVEIDETKSTFSWQMRKKCTNNHTQSESSARAMHLQNDSTMCVCMCVVRNSIFRHSCHTWTSTIYTYRNVNKMTLKTIPFTKMQLAFACTLSSNVYAWMFDKSIFLNVAQIFGNMLKCLVLSELQYENKLRFLRRKRRRKKFKSNRKRSAIWKKKKKTNYVCTQVNLTHIQSKHCN